MKKWKRAGLYTVGIASLLFGLFFPWPGQEEAPNLELMVSHAVASALSDERVWTKDSNESVRWQHLHDATFISKEGKLYFQNGTDIPDDFFSDLGLQRLPSESQPNFSEGDIIFSFSFRDMNQEPTESLQFSYMFGPLGAHGYEIQVKKSLLMKYYLFVHRWVS